jgi:hypothetical protein
MRERRIKVLAVIGLTFACGRWETITFVDEGELCFEQRGSEVIVQVTAPDCLASGCSRDVEGSCSAALEGTTIQLTSEIVWEEDESKFAQCKSDCRHAVVECSAGVLAPGSYTVVHGEDEVPLVVPADGTCPF